VDLARADVQIDTREGRRRPEPADEVGDVDRWFSRFLHTPSTVRGPRDSRRLL
jgi:hypothetical protein